MSRRPYLSNFYAGLNQRILAVTLYHMLLGMQVEKVQEISAADNETRQRKES